MQSHFWKRKKEGNSSSIYLHRAFAAKGIIDFVSRDRADPRTNFSTLDIVIVTLFYGESRVSIEAISPLKKKRNSNYRLHLVQAFVDFVFRNRADFRPNLSLVS